MSFFRTDPQFFTEKLCKLIYLKDQCGEFKYDLESIAKELKSGSYDVNLINEKSGIVPLRYAIRIGRLKVIDTLLQYQSNPLKIDDEGFIIDEVLGSTVGGNLSILKMILKYCDTKELEHVLIDRKEREKKPSRYSMNYLLERATRFPHYNSSNQKMTEIGLRKISRCFFEIIGQSYGIETMIRDVSNHLINEIDEKNKKPLVMIFTGLPGHGKSETAKVFAESMEAKFIKIDCKNHNTPFGMFGSDAGFIGSDSTSSLSEFVKINHKNRCVVLLDEFDHCNKDVYESFYQIFGEGDYTLKKSCDRSSSSATQVLKCNKTIFILTTNKFDKDIDVFYYKDGIESKIKSFSHSSEHYDTIQSELDDLIRPKIVDYFKDGLARRIDTIVPFFRFSEEEAHVITDLHLDDIRYNKKHPKREKTSLTPVDFDISDFAVGELSKSYFKHAVDGATAIHREVSNKIVKRLNDQWLRDGSNTVKAPFTYHYDEETKTFIEASDLSQDKRNKVPYFKRQHSVEIADNNNTNDGHSENDDNNVNNESDTIDNNNNDNNIRDDESSDNEYPDPYKKPSQDPNVDTPPDYNKIILSHQNPKKNKNKILVPNSNSKNLFRVQK